jgi:ComF family protein
LAAYFAARTVQIHEKAIRQLRPDYLVPIPLHPAREYGRGYNQARVFAEALAGPLGLALATDLLIRTGKRREQARLRQSDRARNVRGVFEVWNEEAVDKQARLLLVDDVVTSGETAFEARRVLRENGYQVVGVISIAHGL